MQHLGKLLTAVSAKTRLEIVQRTVQVIKKLFDENHKYLGIFKTGTNIKFGVVQITLITIDITL